MNEVFLFFIIFLIISNIILLIYWIIDKILSWYFLGVLDYKCPKCENFPANSYNMSNGELYPKIKDFKKTDNEWEWIEMHRCVICNRRFGFRNRMKIRDQYEL